MDEIDRIILVDRIEEHFYPFDFDHEQQLEGVMVYLLKSIDSY